jgi:hypothetical protein
MVLGNPPKEFSYWTYLNERYAINILVIGDIQCTFTLPTAEILPGNKKYTTVVLFIL